VQFAPTAYSFHGLLWLQSGQVQISNGRRRLLSRPGQIIYRRAGEKVSFKVHDAQAMQGIYVHFKAPEAWIRSQPSIKVFAGHPVTLQMIQFLADTNPSELKRSGATVLAAVLATLSAKPRHTVQARWRHMPLLVRRCTELFRMNPARKYSLGSLCEELGASPSTLCRQFKQALGLAPLDVLRRMRLESAAQRFEMGDERVAEVALSLGFANPFHFTRLFTGAYGLSPKAYRARAAKGVYRQWRLIERASSSQGRMRESLG
jgi:AraC-like DNA-binding protein